MPPPKARGRSEQRERVFMFRDCRYRLFWAQGRLLTRSFLPSVSLPGAVSDENMVPRAEQTLRRGAGPPPQALGLSEGLGMAEAGGSLEHVRGRRGGSPAAVRGVRATEFFLRLKMMKKGIN